MFQFYNARIEVGGKKRNWYVHIWVDIVKIPAIYYASNFVWIEEIDFNSGFAESHNVIFSSGQQILQPSSRSIGKQTSIIHSYLSRVCQEYLQTKPFAWQIYWHNVPRILRVFNWFVLDTVHTINSRNRRLLYFTPTRLLRFTILYIKQYFILAHK